MRSFDGSDPQINRKWLKNVNMYARFTGYKHVAVVYITADGPVSVAIQKAISEG